MTRAHWIEAFLLTTVAALLAAATVLHAGSWGWSWDALNHHAYLGLIAQQPRWHLDVLAASAQSYQYPYLYWPFYQVTTWPVSPVAAGAIYAALQALLIFPPVWWIAYNLLPAGQGSQAQARFERTAACALAGSSLVVISGVGTTANDLLCAVPFLWALALTTGANPPGNRRVAAAAALWGVSTAFKWSNGLALPWLAVWWWHRPPGSNGLRRAAAMAVAALLGFGAAFAPWGWQLWQQTGNPFHPLFSGLFGA